MRRLPSAAPNELPPPLLPYRARAWRARTGCPPPRDATPPVCTHVEEASQEEVRCGAEGDEELGQEKRGGRDANNAAPEGRRRAHGRPGDPALRSVPCTGPELGPPCGRVAVSARMRLRELRLAEQLGSAAHTHTCRDARKPWRSWRPTMRWLTRCWLPPSEAIRWGSRPFWITEQASIALAP